MRSVERIDVKSLDLNQMLLYQQRLRLNQTQSPHIVINDALPEEEPFSDRKMPAPVLLAMKDVTRLARIPSSAKVSSMGLHKKILFQHFKHGFIKPSQNPIFSREIMLNNIM